jgi:hypothetical protein
MNPKHKSKQQDARIIRRILSKVSGSLVREKTFQTIRSRGKRTLAKNRTQNNKQRTAKQQTKQKTVKQDFNHHTTKDESSIRTARTRMEDPDIPIAYGTPIGPPITTYVQPTDPIMATAPPVRDIRSATAMNGGSSRVMLPNSGQEPIPLSDASCQALLEQGFTLGLATALSRNKFAIPLTIWVVDNSGSMSHRDGHRLVATKHHELKQVSCTRWTELQQTGKR